MVRDEIVNDNELEIQKLLPVSVKEVKQSIHCVSQDTGLKRKLALIVIVGGITYLEIAALRQIKRLVGYESNENKNIGRLWL